MDVITSQRGKIAWFLFGSFRIIICGGKSTPLLKVMRRFLQFLQENFGIILSVGHDLFLRSPFLVHQFYHHSIICTHKRKFVLIYTIKTCKGRRGIFSLILNPSKVNSMPRPLYAQGYNSCTHWNGSWLGSMTGMDVFGEQKISGLRRVSNPGPSSQQHSHMSAKLSQR